MAQAGQPLIPKQPLGKGQYTVRATFVETKKRLWDGVFDYDLNAFAPGGPENSPDTAFLAIRPERALVLKQYGVGGSQRWSAG